MRVELVPGLVLLDKFRVDRILGAGGMGIVIAATHLHLNERVAMKFLLPEVSSNAEAVERFLREAQSSIRLKGEHVARVMDVGAMPDGLPYIVMEFLDGFDLGRKLQECGALPIDEAVDYVLPVCEALAEAHAHGIVHRDIKPANIFLARRPDGSPLVKVLDFGISKSPAPPRDPLTRSFVSMGTPAYMSPEQMRSARDVKPTADIWALGVVLYECLSGRRPFDSESFPALALSIATDPTPRLHAGVPSDLARVIHRCLEKDPRARYASMSDLAAALAPYAGDRRAAETIVERTRMMCDRCAPARRVASGEPMPARGSTWGGKRLAIRSAIIVAPAVVAMIWSIARSEGRPAHGPAQPSMKVAPSPGPASSDSVPARAPTPAIAVPAVPKTTVTVGAEQSGSAMPAPLTPVSRARTGALRPSLAPPRSSVTTSSQEFASRSAAMPRPALRPAAPAEPGSSRSASPQPVLPRTTLPPAIPPPSTSVLSPSVGRHTESDSISTRTRGQPVSPDDL